MVEQPAQRSSPVRQHEVALPDEGVKTAARELACVPRAHNGTALVVSAFPGDNAVLDEVDRRRS